MRSRLWAKPLVRLPPTISRVTFSLPSLPIGMSPGGRLDAARPAASRPGPAGPAPRS